MQEWFSLTLILPILPFFENMLMLANFKTINKTKSEYILNYLLKANTSIMHPKNINTTRSSTDQNVVIYLIIINSETYSTINNLQYFFKPPAEARKGRWNNSRSRWSRKKDDSRPANLWSCYRMTCTETIQ